MPRYKDELIEQIRSANDIVDVIGSVVKLKKKGANYFGLCPFHNEKTGSFSVSPDKQMYYCFGCGAGGNVISFVMEYENYSFPEAVKYLADKSGIALPEAEESEEEKREASVKESVMECLKSAAVFYYKRLYSDEGKLGLAYLHKRGLSDETIKKFGLGYSGKGFDQAISYLRSKGFKDKIIQEAGLCNISEKHGMTDRFFNRVMFPIMDINSRVIGFGGRVMGDGEPKYLNSPETIVFDKSHNMYGLNVARRSRKPYRIVCEGYMDVISMHQAGFTETVASLGTAFTPGHAALLRRYTKDIRLAYDSDGAGQKAAMRSIAICREAGLNAKVIHMDPHKDPDEFIKALGADAFEKRIEEAENSFYFEIDHIRKGYDMNDPESRTSFQSETASRLAMIDDELLRDNYITGAASRFAIKEDLLRRAVNIAMEKAEAYPKKPAYFAEDDRDSRKAGNKGGREDAEKDPRIVSEDRAERYLLTWMVSEKAIYDASKDYLKPEDYTEGLNRMLAVSIYKGYESGELKIADIMTDFAKTDMASEAASVINMKLDAVESKADREKALTDLVIKIKKMALARSRENGGDADPLKAAREEKKAMESLKKIKISIQ